MRNITMYVVLTTWALMSAACASHHAGEERSIVSRTPSPHMASQKDSAELALILRREADDLRQSAAHHEREAALLSDRGADEVLVRENRELAERLWREADEKQQEAVAIGRQVPHNMVQ
jgi:hypothetical protein